jgi:hypothetical protein
MVDLVEYTELLERLGVVSGEQGKKLREELLQRSRAEWEAVLGPPTPRSETGAEPQTD